MVDANDFGRIHNLTLFVAITYKHCVFSDAFVFLFCSMHTMIQLGNMETQLDKHLERAFFDDLGGTTAFDDKVAAHQDLQKAE